MLLMSIFNGIVMYSSQYIVMHTFFDIVQHYLQESVRLVLVHADHRTDNRNTEVW